MDDHVRVLPLPPTDYRAVQFIDSPGWIERPNRPKDRICGSQDHTDNYERSTQRSCKITCDPLGHLSYQSNEPIMMAGVEWFVFSVALGAGSAF